MTTVGTWLRADGHATAVVSDVETALAALKASPPELESGGR